MVMFTSSEGQPLRHRGVQEKFALPSATGPALQIEHLGVADWARPMPWPQFKKDARCRVKPAIKPLVTG